MSNETFLNFPYEPNENNGVMDYVSDSLSTVCSLLNTYLLIPLNRMTTKWYTHREFSEKLFVLFTVSIDLKVPSFKDFYSGSG